MNRRGFLGAMLTACAAPAIVRADSLMRIVPVEPVYTFKEYMLGFSVKPDILRVDCELWFTRDAKAFFLDQNGILRTI